MAKVVDMRVHNVEMPLKKVFMTSNKTVTASRLVFVNLRTDDGANGWGEAPLNPTFTSETPASAREALERLADQFVLGRDADEVVASAPEIGRTLGSRVGARCAMSIALWDLHARRLGAPLYKLFGGARRTSIPVAYHLGSFDAEGDAKEAGEAVAGGFEILKLKVGRADVAEDLEAVRRIRETVGSGTRLYVDVNQAWNRDQALAFAQHARRLGVAFVEQPLAQWDLAGLAQLSATPGVVFGADESIFDAAQLLAAVSAGTVPGGVVVKALKAGGLDGVRGLLQLCEVAGIRPFLAGMPGDSSVVSAALLHVAVAASELPLGTAVAPHFSREDVVTDPLAVVDGHLHLDAVEGPGLGVQVDVERVESLTKP